MRQPVRLEGGPFDGDSGFWRGAELPTSIWAYACHGTHCPMNGIHWTTSPTSGCERYDFDRMDQVDTVSTAVYIYANMKPGSRVEEGDVALA